MIDQTIALFRYQLLGIINTRIVLLVVAIYSISFLASRFVAELAIINSEPVALAFMADFLRYSLIFLLIISLSYQVSQDFELGFFERLLAMPVSRAQYILAQYLVLLTFALMLILPVFFVMLWLRDLPLAFYWFAAVFLEMILIGQFALLAILSLEKLPLAVIFTLAVYLLAKFTPWLDLIFSQSMDFYQQEQIFQFSHRVFSAIQYLLPDMSAFARNNLIFELKDSAGMLLNQLISVMIYGLFILFVILIDFYRKEFNRA